MRFRHVENRRKATIDMSAIIQYRTKDTNKPIQWVAGREDGTILDVDTEVTSTELYIRGPDDTTLGPFTPVIVNPGSGDGLLRYTPTGQLLQNEEYYDFQARYTLTTGIISDSEIVSKYVGESLMPDP